MRVQREKCRFYRSAGVDVCWLVDPLSRTVEVFDSSLDGAVLRANDALELAAMPGFRVELTDLFTVLDSLDPSEPA
jgi:Uma2 family endonuclease